MATKTFVDHTGKELAGTDAEKYAAWNARQKLEQAAPIALVIAKALDGTPYEIWARFKGLHGHAFQVSIQRVIETMVTFQDRSDSYVGAPTFTMKPRYAPDPDPDPKDLAPQLFYQDTKGDAVAKQAALKADIEAGTLKTATELREGG